MLDENMSHKGEAQQTVAFDNREKSRGKKPWKGLLLLLCFFLIILLNDILRLKSVDGLAGAQMIAQGYYREPENSLDVLCLGASSIMHGVSGLEMFKEYGFTTYSRASGIQMPVISYYLLQETLERQNIKAVVMDASPLSSLLLNGYTKQDIVGKMHTVIDYMPWSKCKLDLIQEILATDLPATFLDLAFPLYTYHDRWQEISKQDFTYRSALEDYCYKGQNPTLAVKAGTFDALFMTQEDRPDDSFWIDAEAAMYVGRIIQLCRDKGIRLVLVKMPSISWKTAYHDEIEAFAEENGVDFIDFNLAEIREEIDFNPRQDFSDGSGHLNITGAKKASQYLGRVLDEACDFDDRRGDPAFASWDADLKKYESLLEDALLCRESNLIAYLERLDNPDYIAMIATRRSTRRYFNDEIAGAFGKFGIDAPFGDHEYLSYAAVLDGGRLVYQEVDADPNGDQLPVTCSGVVDGHSISINSLAARISSAASIVFDGEEVCNNGYGFNFAVYDKRVNQIVSSQSFNTGLGGKNYTLPNPLEECKDDPLKYLELLSDDDCLVAMAVSAEGSRYMPGVLNDRFIDMGLLPLDGAFDRPYLAVLDGGEVVYNEYGEPKSQISARYAVGDVEVVAVSDTRKGKRHAYLSIGGEEQSLDRKNGLAIMVYSKSQGRMIDFNRFDWSKNYLSPRKVDGIEDLTELLSIARNNGYDVLALCGGEAGEGVDPQKPEALREYGFTGLDETRCYAGVVSASGQAEQSCGEASAELNCDLGGASARLYMDRERGSASFDAATYGANEPGLYVLLYDPAVRAVLTMNRYAGEG